MAIRAKYVGPDYLNGIPAQDLDEDAYQALTAEQRKDVRESGAYEVLSDREYADAARAAKRGEPPPARAVMAEPNKEEAVAASPAEKADEQSGG